MKTHSLLVLAAAVAVLVGCADPTPRESVRRVKYRGEWFTLVKPVANFDYSDDRVFVREEEGERIERLMLAAPIGTSFANLPEVLAAVEEVRFPGYPRSILPEQYSSDTGEQTHIVLVALEIPRREKNRYLTFRSRLDGGYDLVDDFVLDHRSTTPESTSDAADAKPATRPKFQVVAKVDFQGDVIRYLDPYGAVIREKSRERDERLMSQASIDS